MLFFGVCASVRINKVLRMIQTELSHLLSLPVLIPLIDILPVHTLVEFVYLPSMLFHIMYSTQVKHQIGITNMVLGLQICCSRKYPIPLPKKPHPSVNIKVYNYVHRYCAWIILIMATLELSFSFLAYFSHLFWLDLFLERNSLFHGLVPLFF